MNNGRASSLALPVFLALAASTLPLQTLILISLLALNKKYSGIRPITVGYTWRRLALRCANSQWCQDYQLLAPIQFGVDILSGSCPRNISLGDYDV